PPSPAGPAKRKRLSDQVSWRHHSCALESTSTPADRLREPPILGVPAHDGPRARTVPQDLSNGAPGFRHPGGGPGPGLLHVPAGGVREPPSRVGPAHPPIRLV